MQEAENSAIKYIFEHSSPEPEVLSKLSRETWLTTVSPQMLAGHIQGSLLRMISKMLNPDMILEIGTFTGYSAICLASGLKPDGKLHTIDINPELEEISKRYFRLAGLSNQIVWHCGDALQLLPKFTQLFDLVYLDAAKELYVELYELIIPLLRPGGFIIADNVLWHGKVTDPAFDDDKDTLCIRKFNNHVRKDSRCENLILPLRDGIMLIRKK